MPRRQPPKNSTWVQLTRDFVKEWPEVLEGLEFQNMPVKYLERVELLLKNAVTIIIDIKSQMQSTKYPFGGANSLKRSNFNKQDQIAKFLQDTIKKNYFKIKSVSLKFDVPKLKKDMQSKTSNVLSKSFKK